MIGESIGPAQAPGMGSFQGADGTPIRSGFQADRPMPLQPELMGTIRKAAAIYKRTKNMSQNERDYSEKRDFIRMQLETGVTLEHSDTKLSGTCIDLSSTGMQIVARTDLQLGDRVRVLIPSEHSELEGLDAQTEVVRVSRLDDGRQRLGLAILAMS